MTLTELLESVLMKGGIEQTRRKDFKTSLRYLAKALGTSSLDDCHVDNLLQQTWKESLNRYLGTLPDISHHTVRNTRNNLNTLFLAARALDIIPAIETLPSPQLRRREAYLERRRTSPYRERMSRGPYGLPPSNWPVAISATWERFCHEHRMKLKSATLQKRQTDLTYYLGFLHNVTYTPVMTWDALFDVALLDRFVRWHSQRHHIRLSPFAQHVAITLKTLARYYRHPQAEALCAYTRDLPVVEPMHLKQYHWITLRELEQIALNFLKEAYKPYDRGDSPHPGSRRSHDHQLALILRLLIRVPLRIHNICNMQRDRNLYQDNHQHWHLEFKGEELKVSRRGGQINTFHINLNTHCPELIPHLEEFILAFRMRFPHADQSTHVFLNQRGKPLVHKIIEDQLSNLVYRYTQKRFYPHLVRTIWATEYISTSNDPDPFTTAAYMLNNTATTVLKAYHEVRAQDHLKKASHFLKNILTTGETPEII